MRTLNRPMFRYGGPIKEGVMNGIREPRRNGGSMGKQFNTGLVGDERYPKTDGREHHFAILPPLYAAGAAALRFLPALYRGFKGARTLAPGKLGKLGRLKDIFSPSSRFRDTVKTRGGYSQYGSAAETTPSYTKIPGEKLGIWKALGDPKRLGAAIRENPGTALTLGSLTGSGASMLWPDGTPKTEEEIIATSKQKRGVSGAPGGGDPNMTYTAPPPPPTAAEIEAAEAENRIKQMKKYKEIMDIKGMSKNAAYKSLVDASKIIQEGGNLKEQIKDGSLITKLIGATSKRFDKVSDTESALRSLVAKGEIDKELNKDKNKLDNAVKNAQLDAYTKQNQGLTTAEIIKKRMLTATGEMPQGDALRTLISINNPGLNAKTLPSGKMKQGQDPLEYITQVITAVNNDPETPTYPAGVYIIKDTIIQVDGEGNVTPIPINALN